jgi:hypothetical protein
MGFVLNDNPNFLTPNTNMPTYGTDAKVIQFDFRNITTEKTDPYKGPRCDTFWQRVWQEYGDIGEDPPSEEDPPYEPEPPERPPVKGFPLGGKWRKMTGKLNGVKQSILDWVQDEL